MFQCLNRRDGNLDNSRQRGLKGHPFKFQCLNRRDGNLDADTLLAASTDKQVSMPQSA